MEKLAPFIWLDAATFTILSLWLLGANVSEAWVFRDKKQTAHIGGSVLMALVVYLFLPAPHPIRIALASMLAFAGLKAAQRAAIARTKSGLRASYRKNATSAAALHLAAIIGCCIFIAPFLWLVSTSVKEEDEMVKFPPVWIPTRQVMIDYKGKECGLSTFIAHGHKVRVAEIADLEDGSKSIVVLPNQPGAGAGYRVMPDQLTKIRHFGLKWENYRRALEFLPKESRNGLRYLWNTVFITVMCIIGTLLSCSIAAYSFSRLRWPGREGLFATLLATMMIPAAVTMAPVFLIFRKLGMVDTLYPLWITSFLGAPFAIFLLRQFFLTIPMDLEEAAKIDGADYFTIFWKVDLPLVKPALAALAIMVFLGSWNNFMGPLIYLNSPEKMTVAYALQLFQGEHSAEYGLTMAASVMVLLPVIIVFFLAQKYLIEGITLTGIKG